jgi:hypothetical protein
MKVRNKEELKMMQDLKETPIIKDTFPKPLEGRELQIKPVCLLMAYMVGLMKW